MQSSGDWGKHPGDKRDRPGSMRESSVERPSQTRKVSDAGDASKSGAGEVPDRAASVSAAGRIASARQPIQSTGSIGSLGNIDDLMPGSAKGRLATLGGLATVAAQLDATRLLQSDQANALMTSGT